MTYIAKTLFVLAVFHTHYVYGHARWAEAEEGGLTPARSSATGIKSGPCGNIARESDPSRPATVLQSGSTVSLKIFQDIYHAGDYRIYFSPSNDQGLFAYDVDNQQVVSNPSSENTLLAENILLDEDGVKFYNVDVTLPNISCQNCTLQLVQHMPNRNNPFYYSCADIILKTDASGPGNPVDTSPPQPVTAMVAVPGDSQVQLSWTNPREDFSQVLLLQSAQALTANPSTGIAYALEDNIGGGKLIYKGPAESQTIANLVNGNEYVFSIFAADNVLNYSSATTRVVNLETKLENQAPKIELLAEQAGVIGSQFTTQGGDIIVQANIEDANNTDTHSYTWSGSDTALIDIDVANSTFTLDPSGLNLGEYSLSVLVNDNGESPLAAASTFKFTIVENNSVPTLVPTTSPPPPSPSAFISPAPEDATSNAESPEETGSAVDWRLIFAMWIVGLAVRSLRRNKF